MFGIEIKPNSIITVHLNGGDSNINFTCINDMRDLIQQLKCMFQGKLIDVILIQEGRRLGQLMIDCS
jgi:hypothetical protein